MCVTLADVAKGRVMMMMPSCLKSDSEIGAFQGVNPLGADSPHYFMCVGVEGEYSYWCPLSSKKKPPNIGSRDKQGAIQPDSKLGFDHWTSKESWYDSAQVWKVKNDAIVVCAGAERSNRREGKVFNMVSISLIHSIFPGASSLGDTAH
jgi:hypothetical protein